MAQFKCKMCGGNITVSDNQTTATCEFCGTEQTITKIDNEKKVMLFNRANSARLVCDFDKALRNYESILVEFPNDAEAHWGLCLCRYGIEYVNDPRTGRKIPTCHRTLYTSIFDDEDYKEAIKNADVVARELYKAEADVIDKIQKNIIAISQREEPFDIFICYKETDEKGKRTIDSVIAQDIYEKLIEKGYKVFFSRITLETKIGLQYEPIIFAALQSAKVMLVIGSKVEYFNAVWVKNEWSRFLSFMQTNKNKYLIPCFKDMEAYDMPEEFLSLQAQSIDKLGFMQDLVRGIDKILERNIKTKLEEKTTVVHSDVNVEALLTRIEMLLDDEDWNKADELLEKILNNDPKNSKAYFYKLMIELECGTIEALLKCGIQISKYSEYKKAFDFADTGFKKILQGYNEQILKNIEEKRLNEIYSRGLSHYKNQNYLAAYDVFKTILQYKDSSSLAEKCLEIENEKKYKTAISYMNQRRFKESLSIFKQILEYKDSKEKIVECDELIELERKELIYLKATKSITGVPFKVDLYKKAIQDLKSIPGHKDSDELVLKYENRIKKHFEDLAKHEEEVKKQRKIRRDRFVLFLKISIPLIILLIGLIILSTEVIIPEVKYNSALNYIEDGNYTGATVILKELDGYKESKEKLLLIQAAESFSQGDYEKGIEFIYNLGGTINVTYDGDGGIAPSPEIIKKKNYIDGVASKDGYTFYGWVLDSFSFVDLSKSNDVNIVLKASYKPILYDITYELNGGKLGSSYLVNTYDITKEMKVPNLIREGYTFLGWKSKKDENPKVDYVIEKGSFGNISLTAYWESNIYTITYDAQGGSITSETQDVIYGESYSLYTPVKEGYKFKGWYLDGKGFYSGTWNKTQDIKLVAKWEIITYTIDYDLNNGTVSGTNPKSYNVESKFSVINPVRVGYTFQGWQVNNSTNLYKTYSITTGMTGNLSLDAVWEANSYKIYFDSNGGDDVAEYIDVTYDEDYILPVPTKLGFQFKGWTNGSEIVNDGKWTELSDLYLTAKWEYIGFSIIYTLNGGINDKTNPTTFTIDTEDIVIKNPTKVGYTFKGWKENGIGSLINPYTVRKGTNNHVYLTAVWEANIYEVSFNTYSDECDIEPINYTFDSKVVLPTPTKVGYDFVGWYYDGSLISNTIDKWSIASDCELDAEWTARNDTVYTVNHYIENVENDEYIKYKTEILKGESDSSLHVDVNSYTGFTSPAKQYIKINADGSTVVNYYYSRNEYLVTFVSNGGSAVSSCYLKYEASLPENAVSIRTGEDFGGWYLDKNLSQEFDLFMPADDITLYAYWNGESKAYEFDYTESNTGITILSYKSSNSNVVIPKYINNKKVIKIENDAFKNNNSIKTIKITEYVTSLGNNTFEGCINLQSIEINSSVDFIGSYCFNNCTNLYSILLPDTVNTIGEYVFNNCTSLTSVNIPEKLSTIPQHMFNNCSSLVELYIPVTVSKIEDAALSGCYSLESLTIPFVGNEINLTFDNVNSRFGEIFGITQYENSYLAYQSSSYGGISYYIPSKLKYIYILDGNLTKYSFGNCISLTEIVVLGENSKIESYSLNGCNSIEKIVIPNLDCKLPYVFGSTNFGYDLYSITYPTVGSITKIWMPISLKSVTLTNTINLIDYAFYHCSQLEEINFNTGLEKIGNYAFSNLEISSLIIPDTVKYIGDYAFYCCENLIFDISINNRIETIGDAAFYQCYKLGFESISFLKKCKTIGREAFYDIDSIVEIDFSNSAIEKIWFSAFNKCDNVETLIVPRVAMDPNYEHLASLFATKSSAGTLGTITTPEALKKVVITEEFDGKLTNIRYLEEVVIEVENGNINIPAKAFSSLENLNSVVINCTKYSIGDYAFEGCYSLCNFNFKNCTHIGSYAFNNCTSLEEVILFENTSVGSYAFNNCTGLRKIDASAKNVSLGAGTFKSCNGIEYLGLNTSILEVQPLKWYFPSVAIPSHNNYSNCLGSKLKEVYIDGDDYVVEGCLDFANVTLDVLSFGENVKHITPMIKNSSSSSLSYSSVKSFVVSEDNPYYCVYNGSIYTKDLSKMIWELS